MLETTCSVTDAFFKKIPKVELHCHLYGTIRLNTLKDFVREAGAPMTEAEIEGFYVRGDKPKGVLHIFRFMEEYIFGDADRLYRLTYECLEDLQSDNVRYAELFWNSTGTLRHNLQMSFKVGQAAIISAMKAAETGLGIQGRLIHAIDRQAPPEDALEMVESMILHPHEAVIGIGIDYLETDHPPEGFLEGLHPGQGARVQEYCPCRGIWLSLA